MLIAAIFVLFFAFLDRLSGGWPQVPGRGQYYVFLFVPVAMLLGINWYSGLLIACAFYLWRAPAWSFLGGSLAPFPHEYLGTFRRHLWGSFWLGLTWIAIRPSLQPFEVLALIGFAVFATFLAILNRKDADEGIDINAGVEIVRGALYGFVTSLHFL